MLISRLEKHFKRLNFKYRELHKSKDRKQLTEQQEKRKEWLLCEKKERMKKLQNYNKNNFEREKEKFIQKILNKKLNQKNFGITFSKSILMKAVRNLKLQNGSEINRTGDVKRPLFRSLLARPF